MRPIASLVPIPLLAVSAAPLLAQAAQQPPVRGSTIVQAIWLGGLILFVVAVFTVGFTAKKIDNIHHPTYGKAFLAQLLFMFAFPATFGLFALFFQAPMVVAFGVPYVLLPIAIYKMVFGSMWREAALIWLVVTVVQTGVGYGLILAGVLSLAAITGGAPA